MSIPLSESANSMLPSPICNCVDTVVGVGQLQIVYYIALAVTDVLMTVEFKCTLEMHTFMNRRLKHIVVTHVVMFDEFIYLVEMMTAMQPRLKPTFMATMVMVSIFIDGGLFMMYLDCD